MNQDLHSYFNKNKKEIKTEYLEKYINYSPSDYSALSLSDKNVSYITSAILSTKNDKFETFIETAKDFMKLVEHHSSALKNKRLMNETGFEKVNDIKDAGLSEKQYKQMNNLYEQLKDLMRNF